MTLVVFRDITVLSLLMSVCIKAMSYMKFFYEKEIEAAVFSNVYHLIIGTLH